MARLDGEDVAAGVVERAGVFCMVADGVCSTGGAAVKVLDLFSGIGSFSLAVRWMGWETIQFIVPQIAFRIFTAIEESA